MPLRCGAIKASMTPLGIHPVGEHMPASQESSHFTLRDCTLAFDGRPVLEQVPAEFTLHADTTNAGIFLCYRAPTPAATLEPPLGTIPNLLRFTSIHRDEPWWM